VVSYTMSIKVLVDSYNNSGCKTFISDHPKRSIFQTIEMYNVFKKAKMYHPFFLSAFDEDSGNILATMMGTIKVEKEGVLKSFSSHASIRGGPLFLDTSNGNEGAQALFAHYDRNTAKKSLYTRIYNYHDPSDIRNILRNRDYIYEDYKNYIIDLRKGTDEVLQSMKKPKRKAIRRAIREGVQVIEIESLDQIEDFYKCLTKTFDRSNWFFPDISLFKAAFEQLVPKKRAIFHLAILKDTIIGGRISLLYDETIYAWFVGTDYAYRKLGVNTYLNWNILKWGIENGFESFDFGGAGRLDEISGIARFKKEFGGTEINFGRFTRINRPFTYNVAKKYLKYWKKSAQDLS